MIGLKCSVYKNVACDCVECR